MCVGQVDQDGQPRKKENKGKGGMENVERWSGDTLGTFATTVLRAGYLVYSCSL